MKKHFIHIDEIRFLMIHLILINHFGLSYPMLTDKVDSTLVTFWFEITSPILALLSGYLFFYGMAEHPDFGQKIRRRIPSLVVPYLIWSVGFYFIYFGIKEFSGKVLHLHFWYNDAQPLSVSGVLDSLIHPPLINFWYLQNLILIIPFNFIFYFILKSRVASAFFFTAILVIFAYHLVPLYFEPRFLPFYLIGCYAGYHKLQMSSLRLPFLALRFQTRTLASVFWVPVILFLGIVTGFRDYDGLLSISMKVAIVLIILVSTWNLLDLYPNSLVNRYLVRYKPYSFFLFAIHTFIFGVVQRPLFQLAGNALANKYFTFAFSFFTTGVVLLITLAMAIQVKKFLPKFFGVITGR